MMDTQCHLIIKFAMDIRASIVSQLCNLFVYFMFINIGMPLHALLLLGVNFHILYFFYSHLGFPLVLESFPCCVAVVASVKIHFGSEAYRWVF